MRATLVVALVLSALFVTDALAATFKLHGHTSQGLAMSATLVNGRLDRLHFRWRAHCGNGSVYRAFTTWRDGDEHVIEQDGKTFSDSGTVRDRQAHHIVLVRHERIAGSFRGTRAIRGTHKTTIRVRRRGKLLDTCRSSIRFNARR